MDNVLADIIDESISKYRPLRAARFSTLDHAAKQASPPRGFAAALSRDAGRGYGLIAELKSVSIKRTYSG